MKTEDLDQIDDKNELPKYLLSAPDYMSAESQKLFDHLVATQNYADAGARVLLQQFCQMRDVAEEGRKNLAADGRVFNDRWGQPRENPWVRIEREAIREMGRIFRALGADQEARGGEPPE